jgi:hypothetical protein
VRRRVDLHHVEVLAVADAHALLADPARLGRRAMLAVDHLGRMRAVEVFAVPRGTAEQERVRQAVLADRPVSARTT